MFDYCFALLAKGITFKNKFFPYCHYEQIIMFAKFVEHI